MAYVPTTDYASALNQGVRGYMEGGRYTQEKDARDFQMEQAKVSAERESALAPVRQKSAELGLKNAEGEFDEKEFNRNYIRAIHDFKTTGNLDGLNQVMKDQYPDDHDWNTERIHSNPQGDDLYVITKSKDGEVVNQSKKLTTHEYMQTLARVNEDPRALLEASRKEKSAKGMEKYKNDLGIERDAAKAKNKAAGKADKVMIRNKHSGRDFTIAQVISLYSKNNPTVGNALLMTMELMGTPEQQKKAQEIKKNQMEKNSFYKWADKEGYDLTPMGYGSQGSGGNTADWSSAVKAVYGDTGGAETGEPTATEGAPIEEPKPSAIQDDPGVLKSADQVSVEREAIAFGEAETKALRDEKLSSLTDAAPEGKISDFGGPVRLKISQAYDKVKREFRKTKDGVTRDDLALAAKFAKARGETELVDKINEQWIRLGFSKKGKK